MRKLAFVCVLLFGAMGVLAGVPKDVLVIGIKHAAIIDFEPARVYEIEGSFVLEQLYDTLVDFEGGGVEAFQRVSPGLAESWEVSADGYTWIFHLRRGARFHSGREVKADAVVFSLRRALELDKPPIWILKQFVNSPDDIKALDDYTVSITMNQKIGEMLMGAVLGFQGICSIVDPEEVKAHATADDPWATQWLGEHDAGSGPYKLVEWVRNDRIVLEAFADYWGGVPRIKRVVLKDIPEPANQMLLLLKGDIDVAWNLLPDQIAELKRKKGVKFVSTPTFIFYYAAMNMGMEPFNHEEVRDAIRYAINYDAIINGILRGEAVPCHTFEPVGLFGHLDLLYPYDPKVAKALLDHAGFVDKNGDGWRDYPDGRPLEIELWVRNDPPYTDIAVQIQQDLAKVGLKLKITQMVYSQLLKFYRAQKAPMVLVRWGIDYVDPNSNAIPFAHCRTAGPEAEFKQLAWRNKFCPSGVSDLVEKAVGILDPVERAEAYKTIQRIVWDIGPYIIIAQPKFTVALRANVQGLEVPPIWSFTELMHVSKE